MIRVLYVIEKISTALERFLLIFGVLLLVAMWLLLLLNTVNRWLGSNYTTSWTLEIVGWMVAWTIFVLMGPVAKYDEHIKISFLPQKFLGEARGLAFIRMLENMAGLAVCTFFAIHTFRWIIDSYHLGYQIRSVAGFIYPIYILRAGIFVGFATTALFYLVRSIGVLLKPDTLKVQVAGHEPGKPTHEC